MTQSEATPTLSVAAGPPAAIILDKPKRKRGDSEDEKEVIPLDAGGKAVAPNSVQTETYTVRSRISVAGGMKLKGDGPTEGRGGGPSRDEDDARRLHP